MRDWKIGTRITAGFAAVMAITLALGLFAWNRDLDIGQKTNSLSTNYLPSVVTLSHLQSNVSNSVNKLHDEIGSDDLREMDRLEGEIKASRALNTAALQAFEALPSTPERVELYGVVKGSRSKFWALFEDIEKTARTGNGKSKKQARLMLDQQLRLLEQKFLGDIQTLINFELKGSLDSLSALQKAIDTSIRWVLIVMVLAILVAVPIALAIIRSITGPLGQTVAVLERVSNCDLSGSLEIHTRDEMGQIATALNKALTKLRSTLQAVSEGAKNANSSSQELSAAAETLATGAQEQAASLEETSASLEEITATVRQSADNARQANQLASSSKDSAESGQEVVANAVTAMEDINVASAKIADIISTINEIAFQTNLLAVNAAVEAARAGEEGRGFAVVASEVRSLAQRSAGAAKEIKLLIEDTLRKVSRGSELVNKSGETLQGIVSSAKRVTDMVREIAAASDEQSTGINQVNTAITQIDHVTQSNSAQTEELSSTAQSLATQSQHLIALVQTFTLVDGNKEPAVSRVPLRTPAKVVAAAKPQPRRVIPKKVTSVKSDFHAASAKLQTSAHPVMAMSGGGGSDDSSFEEF